MEFSNVFLIYPATQQIPPAPRTRTLGGALMKLLRGFSDSPAAIQDQKIDIGEGIVGADSSRFSSALKVEPPKIILTQTLIFN